MFKNAGFSFSLVIIFLVVLASGCSRGSEEGKIQKLLEKGIRSSEKGDMEEGVRIFTKIIRLEPDNYHAYLNRGINYKEQRIYDLAIEDFKKCMELSPANPETYFQLGAVWSSQDEIEIAIGFYTKALEFDPTFVKAYGTRGIMNSIIGKFDLTIEDLTTAINIEPYYPVLYIVRGLALDTLGDCVQAIEDFQNAMKIDPDNYDTRSNIAWVLATCPDGQCRNGERALTLASQALALKDSHANLKSMAAAYAELGDFENAILFQQKAIDKLSEVIPADKIEERYHKKDQKDYSDQMKSYENSKPWHIRNAHDAGRIFKRDKKRPWVRPDDSIII